MADTEEPKGEPETVVTESLKNEAEPKTTPVQEKEVKDNEAELLRKQLEQEKMEKAQLRNKLEAQEKAKAEADAKELEEKEQFKTLYEQEKSKREEIEREKEAEEQKKALTEAQQNVLNDYPDDVKSLAKDLGIGLGEVSEDAVAEFKAKLDKIQTSSGNQKVTPNNPNLSSGGQKSYTPEELRTILADPVKRDEYYRAKGGVAAQMMQ